MLWLLYSVMCEFTMQLTNRWWVDRLRSMLGDLRRIEIQDMYES